MRFTKNTPQDASKVLRLPRKMTMDASKVLRLPRKLQHIFWKTLQKYCACHAKRLSTRCRTRLNVTKCHACHAKRSNQTSETSKKDHLCKTSHRHGHTVLTRTVANGCGRLRSRTQRRANTPSTPRPPEWNGNPCYAFGKKTNWTSTVVACQIQQISREKIRIATTSTALYRLLQLYYCSFQVHKSWGTWVWLPRPLQSDHLCLRDLLPERVQRYRKNIKLWQSQTCCFSSNTPRSSWADTLGISLSWMGRSPSG